MADNVALLNLTFSNDKFIFDHRLRSQTINDGRINQFHRNCLISV